MAGLPRSGPPIGPPLRQPATPTDADDPPPTEPSLAWRRIRSVLPAALLVEIALLTITGIALWFAYEPTPSQAWDGIFGTELSSSQRLSEALRTSHRVVSILAVLTAALTTIALCAGPGAPLRHIRGRLIAAGLVVATVAAMVTGYELPWDQLALRPVTVGSNVSGFGLIFHDDVLFVLIGDREVDPSTLTRWLVVHTALLGPLVIGLALVVWRRRTTREQLT